MKKDQICYRDWSLCHAFHSIGVQFSNKTQVQVSVTAVVLISAQSLQTFLKQCLATSQHSTHCFFWCEWLVRCPSLLPTVYVVYMLQALSSLGTPKLFGLCTAWRSNSWGLGDLSFFCRQWLLWAGGCCRGMEEGSGDGFVLNRKGGKRESSRVSLEWGCSERRSVRTPVAYCPSAAITLPSLCLIILYRSRIKNNFTLFPFHSTHQ